MRRILGGLVLALALAVSCSAPAAQPDVDTPPDEELHGKIRVWGIEIGQGRVQIWKNYLVNGQPAQRVIVSGETTGIVSLFYRVNDSMETICDPVSCLPMLFRVRFEEGRYRRNQEFVFDQGQGVIEGPGGSRLKMNGPTHDPLSAILYLRAANLEDGVNIQGDVSDGRKIYRMVAAIRKDTRVVDGNKRSCWALEPEIQSVELGGILERKKFRRFTTWITDDTQRIPVYARGELFFGSLTATLERRQVKAVGPDRA